MSNWDFVRVETPRIEVGDHRVVIVDAKETVSRTSGNPMIVVTVSPNGSEMKLNSYFVKNEYFNRNMTQFFDAFPQIKFGDFNFLGWIGCVGAARLKEDEQGYLKVQYFIDAKRAEKLRPWQGKEPERQTVTEFDTVEDADDLPFN